MRMLRLSIYLIMMFAMSAVVCPATEQVTTDGSSMLPSENDNPEIKSTEQASEPFVVRNIIITGNKKTKASIILREIP
ncbi:MAG TPA: hypothetical protein VGG71_16500, partial [Chitinophagaceae bacterium]